jgi:two-component sensor histidine kinase
MLQFSGWLVFGVAMYAWALAYWEPLDAFANKFALIASGVALSLGMRHIYRRWHASNRPRLFTGLLIVGISFAAAAIWIELQSLVFEIYLASVRLTPQSIGLVGIGIGTLLFHGFVLLTWSLLYHGINALEDVEMQRSRAESAESAAHLARLRALQAQLNPHFIFNVLNAVSTLVDEKQNIAAKAMITRLATFLRLVLDTLDTPQVPVAREIEFVRCYLEIERERFGTRLKANIAVEPEAARALIPTLILQPLVENAVKHGILSRESGGTLSVTANLRGGQLCIEIADDGNGNMDCAPARNGIGLSNTTNRLCELYGDQASVAFDGTPQGGKTTLKIPLHTDSAVDEAVIER